MTDPTGGIPAAALAAHALAIARHESTYLDPSTGAEVMTEAALTARGECCGSGCRHCPYPEDEQRLAGRPRRIAP